MLSLYYVALSYGFLVIGLIGGRQSLTRLVANTSMNPLLVLVGVPMIPVSLIILEALDIEDKSLTLWRERVSPSISRLPVISAVVEYLWPTPHRTPTVSHPSGFINTIDYIARSIVGGLTLPFFGYAIGRVLFKKHNNLQKVVLVSIQYRVCIVYNIVYLIIMGLTNFYLYTVCQEMFAAEYFREFRELYTTLKNKNREDMGVVASKRRAAPCDRLWRHCIITSSEILLSQAHAEHYLQVSLLLPLIHVQQQSLRN